MLEPTGRRDKGSDDPLFMNGHREEEGQPPVVHTAPPRRRTSRSDVERDDHSTSGASQYPSERTNDTIQVQNRTNHTNLDARRGGREGRRSPQFYNFPEALAVEMSMLERVRGRSRRRPIESDEEAQSDEGPGCLETVATKVKRLMKRLRKQARTPPPRPRDEQQRQRDANQDDPPPNTPLLRQPNAGPSLVPNAQAVQINGGQMYVAERMSFHFH